MMEWQPIETANGDDLAKELVIASNEDEWVTIGRMIEGQWWELNNHPTDHWGVQLYPTHFAHIPPPPESAE